MVLNSYDEEPWYLEDGSTTCPKFRAEGPDCVDWLSMATRYFLIVYMLVPAALYVSGMIVYMLSMVFALWDVTMYDEKSDEPCKVRQMNLLGDLGQVSHIFSDKTGTLTSNCMEFRRCVVDGVPYGVGDTAISRTVYGEGAVVAKRETPLPSWAGCNPPTATYVGYEEAAEAPSLFEELVRQDEAGARRRELMINMAVNHSVMVETINGQSLMSASSPDEQAFTSAAEYFGFEFVGRDIENGLVIVVDKRRGERYEIEVR